MSFLKILHIFLLILIFINKIKNTYINLSDIKIKLKILLFFIFFIIYTDTSFHIVIVNAVFYILGSVCY